MAQRKLSNKPEGKGLPEIAGQLRWKRGKTFAFRFKIHTNIGYYGKIRSIS